MLTVVFISYLEYLVLNIRKMLRFRFVEESMYLDQIY